jgi:hypothetical protein
VHKYPVTEWSLGVRIFMEARPCRLVRGERGVERGRLISEGMQPVTAVGGAVPSITVDLHSEGSLIMGQDPCVHSGRPFLTHVK